MVAIIIVDRLHHSQMVNLVSNIDKSFEHEYTSNNLIKSDLLIERRWMKGEGEADSFRLDQMKERELFELE